MALASQVAGPAQARPPVPREDAALRARLLLHGGPSIDPRVGRLGRLKRADDTPAFDLLAVDAHLAGLGPDAAATVEVTVAATSALTAGQRLAFVTLDLEVSRVSYVPTGAPLALEISEGGTRTDVTLSMPLSVGERATLRFEGRQRIACDVPSSCLSRGETGHRAQFGWLPASWNAPLSDRFDVTMALPVSDGMDAVGTCESVGAVAAGVKRFSTVRPTYFPAFAWGPWGRLESTTAAGAAVSVYAPPALDESAREVAAVVGVAVDHFSRTLGDWPAPRLSVAPIDDAAGVALAPQCLVLLPQSVFIAETTARATLRAEVLAHEAAHQYFFNSLAVAAPEDAWLSEAFAEHLSTWVSAAREGTPTHARRNYWEYVLTAPPFEDATVTSPQVTGSPRYFEIVYLRGSSVLWMLQRAVGEAQWVATVATLAQTFADEIATTAEVFDLLRAQWGQVFDAHATWLTRPGFPTIEVSATREANRELTLRLTPRANPQGGFEVSLPILVETDSEGTRSERVVLPASGTVELRLPQNARSALVDPELTTLRRLRPQPATDVDLSGVVDGRDLLDVWALGVVVGPDARWDDRLDTNADGAIDDLDAARIERELGRGLP